MAGRPGSSPSPVSGDSWEGSEGSLEDDELFHQHMDEHGVIGMGHAEEEEEEEELWGPEEGPTLSSELDALGQRVRDLVDSDPLSQAPEKDIHPLSFYNLEERRSTEDSAADWLDEEDYEDEEHSFIVSGRQEEAQPERDRQLEVSEEEHGDTSSPRSDTSRPVPVPLWAAEDYKPPPSVDSDSQVSPSKGPIAALVPVQDTVGSMTDHQGHGAGWEWPEAEPTECPALLPRKAKPHPYDLPSPVAKSTPKVRLSPPQKLSCHSRNHGTLTTASSKSVKGSTSLDGSRRGRLTHPLPDYSKIKPKVLFPKEGYKPPVSKSSPSRRAVATGPPLVLKSPADIVREALQNGLDAPPTSEPPTRCAAPVMKEYYSPDQAHNLVHQLQEDYSRLLTKYAEAENTIDRLRLEAKVNLYSDPPKPSHYVHLGTLGLGSKFMNLSFPQAQRAEFGHISPSMQPSQLNTEPDQTGAGPKSFSAEACSQSKSLNPQVGQQLTEALARQAACFQMQLDSFEDHLKSGRLKPFEQMKGLSDLASGLDALERGYLDVRDKHRLLQQGGSEGGAFDQGRELEGQVFRLGVQLEELKEWAEQAVPEQLQFASSPCPTPVPILPLEQCTTDSPSPLPRSPVSPTQDGALGMEVSSVSDESIGDRDEPLSSFLRLCPTLQLKHQQVEEDFGSLLDRYQSFKELPQLLDLGQGAEVTKVAGTGTGPLKRAEDLQPGLPPTPQTGGSDGEPLQGLPPFLRQCVAARAVHSKSPSSSMTSLGESAAPDPQATKLQGRYQRAPPQDGIVSPETDSGFVGSESSRQTPAVSKTYQQRARVRPEDAVEGSSVKPESTQVPPVPVAPGCERPASVTSSRGEDVLPVPSPSAARLPQHWAGGDTRGTSDMCSDGAHSVSDGDGSHVVRYPQPTNEQLHRQKRPSPASSLLHGGLHSGAHRHKAIQHLQAEVDRLRERLEASLRKAPPAWPDGAIRSSTQRGPLFPEWFSPHISFAPDGADEGEGGGVRDEEAQRGRCLGERQEPATSRRAVSTPSRKHEGRTASDSERAQLASNPKSSAHITASRITQGASRRAGTEAAKSRGPRARQQCDPAQCRACNEADHRQTERCSCANSRPHSKVEVPVGGATASHLQHCTVCGRYWPISAVTEVTVSDPSVERDSSGSAPKASRRISTSQGFFLAPPPISSTVPVCPSVLYYPNPVFKTALSYPQFLCLSLGGTRGGTAVRTRGSSRRPGRSLSADSSSLSRSLRLAIESAMSMRATSQRMACSLAAGLRHQKALTQSCMY